MCIFYKENFPLDTFQELWWFSNEKSSNFRKCSKSMGFFSFGVFEVLGVRLKSLALNTMQKTSNQFNTYQTSHEANTMKEISIKIRPIYFIQWSKKWVLRGKLSQTICKGASLALLLATQAELDVKFTSGYSTGRNWWGQFGLKSHYFNREFWHSQLIVVRPIHVYG